MDSRAVSNTLGFVLLFSIILFSIGVVATAGVDSIEGVRDATMSNNAGQSFQTLARDVEDVHREQVSARTVSMRLGQGSLRRGEPTTISVDVNDNGTSEINETFTPLVYEIDDTRLVYESGAVIREENGGAVMVREPGWAFESDRIILPVVATSNDGSQSVSGSNAQIYLRRAASDPPIVETGSDVAVEIDSTERREEIWYKWLDESTVVSCSSTHPVECTVTMSGSSTATKTALVRFVAVEFEFDV